MEKVSSISFTHFCLLGNDKDLKIYWKQKEKGKKIYHIKAQIKLNAVTESGCKLSVFNQQK